VEKPTPHACSQAEDATLAELGVSWENAPIPLSVRPGVLTNGEGRSVMAVMIAHLPERYKSGTVPPQIRPCVFFQKVELTVTESADGKSIKI
jgi:hypothetical protein